MNSISSVGGSSGASSLSAGRAGGPAKQMDKELTKYLESKGISAEEQTSIKADLQQAVQSSLSSGGRPNPSKIQETIQGVFEKHGLDSKEFTNKLPSALGKPGSGSSVKGSSESDQIQSLLDFLTERAEDSKKSSKRASESSADQSSQGSDLFATSPKSNSLRGESSFDVEA